jgi:hypothetical protein
MANAEGGAAAGARSTDWYGWAESPDTPGATITAITPAKPPRDQKIKLAPGQSVIGLLPQPRVAAGQTASAEVPLVSTSINAATLRVLLIRNGTDATSTDFKTFVKVGSAAQVAKIAGKFPVAYASLRIELKNTGTTAVEFIAGSPTIRIGW